ncbi:unnamed protein product, partial [Darwinula stevensoni]
RVLFIEIKGKTSRDPMEKLETLRLNIWNANIWLPGNVTWEDMKSKPGRPMPEFQDLLYAFPFSISFLLFRIIFDMLIMEPLARAEVQSVSTVGPCQQSKVGMGKEYMALSSDLFTHLLVPQGNGSLNAGRKWIEREKGSLRSVKEQLEIRKIRETGYRSVAHSIVFLFGVWTMADKPWLRNTDLCFWNPPHPVPWDIWWYYMLELGFHITQTLMLPFDVKNSDFLAQLTHHVVTIGLMMGSWTAGTIRIGSIVLLVHDCADVILQCGKLLKFFKGPDPDATVFKVFLAFTATWILTRVIYFPLYVNIPATKAILHFDYFYFASVSLVVLLWSLFLLHLYWTYLLLRVIYGMVFRKKKLHDNRSEDEDSDEDDEIGKNKSK